MRVSRHTGFTLVEMLVAIGILALIATLGWRSLDSMLRSRIALTDSMQQTRALQRTFAQIQDDCVHLATVESIGQYPRLRLENNRLGLIRQIFEAGRPSMLQAIVYQVDDGVLRRRESVATRDLPTLTRFLQQPSVGAVRNTALQQDIGGMAIRNWDGGWRTEAPVDGSVTGLELTLLLRAGDGQINRLFLLGAT